MDIEGFKEAKDFNEMKKEKFYCNFINKNIYGFRTKQLQTVYVPKHLLPDSDRVQLEDRNGFRFMRNIKLELLHHSICYIFESY